MVNKFLKIAGVKNEKEFYKLYPTEAAFFRAHPEAMDLVEMQGGGYYGYPQYGYGGVYQYQDGSIVDYLAGKGKDFSKEARAKMAAERGIKDYDFSAEKNLQLLQMLRKEDSGAKASTPKTLPNKYPAAGSTASALNPAGAIQPSGPSSWKGGYKKGQTTASFKERRNAEPKTLPNKRVTIDERNPVSQFLGLFEDEVVNFDVPQDVYDFYQQNAAKNKGKKFGIVSKNNARAYFFDEKGNLSIQDEIGVGKDRGEQQPVYYQVMTTPSGEYVMNKARFTGAVADEKKKGYDADNFFFMDHTDPNKKLKDPEGRKLGARLAMHGIPTHLLKERAPLFGNNNIDDNYMSAGCINCKRPFLDNPYFTNWQTGNVYVTPEMQRKKGGGTTFNAGVWYKDGGMPCYECGGMYMGGGNIPNYMKDPNPLYNFGGYFPQAPRFQDGQMIPFPSLDNYVPSITEMKQGGIHIDPSKKGTFTAAATKAGMSVQGFANKVLSAPEGKYSPAMRKKANFARNAASWKREEGGLVEGQIIDVTPDMLEMLKNGGYTFEIIND